MVRALAWGLRDMGLIPRVTLSVVSHLIMALKNE